MVAVLLVFVIIALIDLRPLFKNGPKRDRIIVSVIFAGVLALCLLEVGGVELPSPMMAAGELVKSLGLAYPPLK